MALFRDMVCYQEEVRDPYRTAEVLNRVITKAKRLSAPAQINIPRDYWTQVIDINLPAIVEFERPAGGTQAIAEAAKLLSTGEIPGDPVGRRRRSRPTPFPNARRLPKSSMRRSAITTSTTTASPAAIA